MRLQEVFAYIQCYFDVEILVDEIETEYIGESEEERQQIHVTKFKTEMKAPSLLIPYDLFTRAIMASEIGKAPKLEANFLRMARTEMLQERYIDSFRYSFLLIESIYGEGQFRTAHLKDALKGNTELIPIVTEAIRSYIPSRRARNSDTEQLLTNSPHPETAIDHIVEKRGFYFHGNLKRRSPWRPHEQETAEVLCLFSLNIAMLISHAAAAPLFENSHSRRHFDNAKRVGAIVTMNVHFRFHDPNDPPDFDREANLSINMPGSKLTPKKAVDAARSFLEEFKNRTPIADLISATCTLAKTGQEVFDMRFYTRPSSESDEGQVKLHLGS